MKINLQLFANDLDRKAKTDTSKKTFAQDVKDRYLSGKTLEQSMAEARSGREVSTEILNGVEVPKYGSVRSVSSESPMTSAEELQRRLIEQQKQAQISSLRGLREGSMAALQRQQEQVEPAFLKQRTGLRTQEQQLGRQTAEQLAAQGLSRSGAQAQSDLARRLQLQQGLTQSGEQQAGVLADIADSRADVERQFQTGVAQAEAGAETAAIQQQLANIQAQRQAEIQAQELQASQAFEIDMLNRKAAIDEQLARIDAELEQSLQSGKLADSIALEQEKARLRDESTRLSASLRSTGGGGLTFSQGRQVFNDQVKQYTSGIDAILGRLPSSGVDAYGNPLPPSSSDQVSAIYSYLSQLENAGVDPSVIDAIANQYGVNPQSTRLGMTESEALTPFQMPQF